MDRLRQPLFRWLILIIVLVIVALVAWLLLRPKGGLSETFTASDGTISFRYPAGWVTGEDWFPIYLASSPDMVRANAPTPDQLAMGILRPTDGIGITLDSFRGDGDPVGILARVIVSAGEANAMVIFGEIDQITINGRSTARAYSSDSQFDALTLVMSMENGEFMVIAAQAALGDLAQFEPTIIAVAETVTYTP